MLYFSYGSNMSSRRLLSRVSSAKFVATAVLSDHVLNFHKRGQDGSAKCDAFETQNSADVVHGVIYDIAVAHKTDLDRIEGVGKGYGKKCVELVASCGEMFHAHTYYATLIDSTIRPYHWYKHHVITGAIEHGLPAAYVDKLRHIGSVEDPDHQRHTIELSIYHDSVEANRIAPVDFSLQ